MMSGSVASVYPVNLTVKDCPVLTLNSETPNGQSETRVLREAGSLLSMRCSRPPT
jgi:hypothetical protein